MDPWSTKCLLPQATSRNVCGYEDTTQQVDYRQLGWLKQWHACVVGLLVCSLMSIWVWKHGVGNLLSQPSGCISEHRTAKDRRPVEGCLANFEPRPRSLWRAGNKIVDIWRVEDIVRFFPNQHAYPAGDPGLNRSWHEGGLVSPEGKAPEAECARQVPKILHFIWVGSSLPLKYARNIMQYVNVNPGWQTILWADSPLHEEVEEFLQEHPCRTAKRIIIMNVSAESPRFHNRDLVDKAMNMGAKADYIRLEVLYLYGGMYLDTDSVAMHGFDEYGNIFRWPFVTWGDGGICNCVFSAEQGSAFLAYAIKVAREICVEFHDCYPPGACGPPLLTSAFMKYAQSESLVIDANFMIYPRRGAENIMFQTFDYSWG